MLTSHVQQTTHVQRHTHLKCPAVPAFVNLVREHILVHILAYSSAYTPEVPSCTSLCVSRISANTRHTQRSEAQGLEAGTLMLCSRFSCLYKNIKKSKISGPGFDSKNFETI